MSMYLQSAQIWPVCNKWQCSFEQSKKLPVCYTVPYRRSPASTSRCNVLYEHCWEYDQYVY